MQKLNLKVRSFLSDPFHCFENKLLPKDVIFLRNIGEGHEVLRERCGNGEDNKDVQDKPKAQPNLSSSLPCPSGPLCVKWTSRKFVDSVFDDPHMDGKLIS
jgi:hypothetical protein